VQDGKAVAVYMAIGAPASSGYREMPQKRPLKYRGFYRSSDEKALGGVCGGLAHMWNMNRTAIQFLFLLLALPYGAGVFIYILLWMMLEEVPTEGVDFSGTRPERLGSARISERPPRPKFRPNIALAAIVAVAILAFLAVLLGLFQ